MTISLHSQAPKRIYNLPQVGGLTEVDLPVAVGRDDRDTVSIAGSTRTHIALPHITDDIGNRPCARIAVSTAAGLGEPQHIAGLQCHWTVGHSDLEGL